MPGTSAENTNDLEEFVGEIFGPGIHAPTGLGLGRSTTRFTLVYYDRERDTVGLGCYANPGRGGIPPLRG
jgi:hypothetical protein